MTNNSFGKTALAIAATAILAAAAVFVLPGAFDAEEPPVERQTRLILPHTPDTGADDPDNAPELPAFRENLVPRINLEEGEAVVSVLNGLFDGGPVEKQFIAYRNLLETDSPIYVTFIDYDEASGRYTRVWSARTAATRPGTVSLFSHDLVGDRSVCVLLSGMNGQGEHTLTAFRKNPVPPPADAPEEAGLFSKIAELRIDGNITVKEVSRPRAYAMGVGRGQSYTILAHSRDFESSNILDQMEITYAYNPLNGLYEQANVTRIPGAQIEQRRLRELLGNAPAFEEFISGLWYFTTPQGTIDIHQYIYFNPPDKEIIFYGDETQQVFNWQNSQASRTGLYISSQNISISTLRRSIDIELESLESIRIRVFEDVRLKIGVNAPWDGSYRKAAPLERQTPNAGPPAAAFIDARYNGTLGLVRFFPDGTVEIEAAGTVRHGKYAFFRLDGAELLELRVTETSGPRRETYLVEGETPPPAPDAPLRKALTLTRVRLGVKGAEKQNEGAVSLTLASESTTPP